MRTQWRFPGVDELMICGTYGLAPDAPEPEIVAHLFGLYAKMINKENEQ